VFNSSPVFDKNLSFSGIIDDLLRHFCCSLQFMNV
jgi:hypothetical protein